MRKLRRIISKAKAKHGVPSPPKEKKGKPEKPKKTANGICVPCRENKHALCVTHWRAGLGKCTCTDPSHNWY